MAKSLRTSISIFSRTFQCTKSDRLSALSNSSTIIRSSVNELPTSAVGFGWHDLLGPFLEVSINLSLSGGLLQEKMWVVLRKEVQETVFAYSLAQRYLD